MRQEGVVNVFGNEEDKEEVDLDLSGFLVRLAEILEHTLHNRQQVRRVELDLTQGYFPGDVLNRHHPHNLYQQSRRHQPYLLVGAQIVGLADSVIQQYNKRCDETAHLQNHQADVNQFPSL